MDPVIVTPVVQPNQVVEPKVVEPKKPLEEPKVVDPKADATKSDLTVEDYAAKLASMSKKEAAIAKREKELEAREKKLTPLQKAQEEKSVLKTFESMGMTFEEAMGRAISELEGNKEPDVKEQVKALEQRLIAKEKAEAEAINQKTQAEQQANIAAFVKKTTEEVKTMEEFECVNTLGSYNLVFDVMNEYFNKTGEVLPSKQAAAEVEKYLEAEFDKLYNTKKFQNKYAKTPVTPVVPTDTKAKTMTLSNGMTPNTAVASKAMTREESLNRAASMLKWNS